MKAALPVKEGLMPRPRVDTLLEHAMNYPLVTVVAGPGFGKTQAVSAFLAARDCRVAWRRMTHLDGVSSRFWTGLAEALIQCDPSLEPLLGETDFPETLAQMDAFVHILAKSIRGGRPLVLVLDEYNQVQSATVDRFVEDLARLSLDSFTIVLISQARINLNLLNLLDNGLLAQITASDLRLTWEEVRSLLERYGLRSDEKTLERACDYLEGWPFALHMLAEYTSHREADVLMDVRAVPDALVVFGNAFFEGYPPILQRDLIRLSLLRAFHRDFVPQVCDSPARVVLDALREHMFVHYDPFSGQYSFQNLLRDYLLARAGELTPAERDMTLRRAADWCRERELPLEAISYYEKCKDYDRMYATILSLPLKRKPRDLADFILDYLDRLPRSFVNQNLMIKCTYGAMHMNNFELDKAETWFLEVLEELEQGPDTEENLAFQGEVCLMLSELYIVKSDLRFAGYYRRADACLPRGSAYRDNRLLLVENNSTLFLDSTEPGSLERVTALVTETMPIAARVMHGCAHGLEHLFAGEAAYAVGDLANAREQCFLAIYKGIEQNQYDIVANARFLLMRLYILEGKYVFAREQLDELCGYIEKNNADMLFNMRDCAIGWFYEAMDDTERVPAWIFSDWDTRQAPIGMGRPRRIMARCLLRQKRYAEVMAIGAPMEVFYRKRGLWPGLLDTYVVRAIVQLKKGNGEKLLEYFDAAYRMAYANRMTTPFTEYGKHMEALAAWLLLRQDTGYDREYLDRLRKESASFSRRSAAMIREHRRLDRYRKDSHDLTPRELEVLRAMAQGLTREEIGIALHISVNTVKSNIKAIYSKLDAVNRAEAIHTAGTLGLL